MIRINGNAAANEIVWSGFNPPAIRRPTAITDWIIPQRIFLLFGGLISPSVVSMDRTYTPELADVIKKRAERYKCHNAKYKPKRIFLKDYKKSNFRRSRHFI